MNDHTLGDGPSATSEPDTDTSVSAFIRKLADRSARNGESVTETLHLVRPFVHALTGDPLTEPQLDLLVSAWVEGYNAMQQEALVMDPFTGLFTSAYLLHRIHELTRTQEHEHFEVVEARLDLGGRPLFTDVGLETTLGVTSGLRALCAPRPAAVLGRGHFAGLLHKPESTPPSKQELDSAFSALSLPPDTVFSVISRAIPQGNMSELRSWLLDG